jgi:hypothetical protein
MMKRFVMFFMLIAPLSLCAQTNFPVWFDQCFRKNNLNVRYELKAFIKPAYLKADFNGDGVIDVAGLIVERKTNKKGVLLILGGSNNYFVFGAGTKFGNGSDDFKWAGGWTVYKDKIAYEALFDNEGDMLGSKKIKLNRPAFFIYDLEDGQPNSGGLIYWNAKKYIWIHQGE